MFAVTLLGTLRGGPERAARAPRCSRCWADCSPRCSCAWSGPTSVTCSPTCWCSTSSCCSWRASGRGRPSPSSRGAAAPLLLLQTLWGAAEAPRPLARLLLLSALFLVFLAAPLFRERATGRRSKPIDLILVVANAAAYFWAVYFTLEATRPALEAPWAVGLAVLYRLVSSDYGSRVPDDAGSVLVHEGVSWTFLTLAIPLALDAQWVTARLGGPGGDAALARLAGPDLGGGLGWSRGTVARLLAGGGLRSLLVSRHRGGLELDLPGPPPGRGSPRGRGVAGRPDRRRGAVPAKPRPPAGGALGGLGGDAGRARSGGSRPGCGPPRC